MSYTTLGHSGPVASAEGCLRRPGTNCVDLLVLHKTDFTTPFKETLPTLQSLIDSGKMHHIGVSNQPAWQVSQAIAIQCANGFLQKIRKHTEVVGTSRADQLEKNLQAAEITLTCEQVDTIDDAASRRSGTV